MSEQLGVRFILQGDETTKDEFHTSKDDIFLLLGLLRQESTSEDDYLNCNLLKDLILANKIDEATMLVHALSGFPKEQDHKMHAAVNIALKTSLVEGQVRWSISFDYIGNTGLGYKFN